MHLHTYLAQPQFPVRTCTFYINLHIENVFPSIGDIFILFVGFVGGICQFGWKNLRELLHCCNPLLSIKRLSVKPILHLLYPSTPIPPIILLDPTLQLSIVPSNNIMAVADAFALPHTVSNPIVQLSALLITLFKNLILPKYVNDKIDFFQCSLNAMKVMYSHLSF